MEDRMEWLPIESAPKDGTPILAHGDKPGEWAVVAWEFSHDCWACAWDNWPLEEFAAVHWMPLPKPPEDR